MTTVKDVMALQNINLDTLGQYASLLQRFADFAGVLPNVNDQGKDLGALCRTIVMDEFARRWVPPNAPFPTFTESLSVLRELLTSDPETMEMTQDMQAHLYRAVAYQKGRSLITTSDGRIGLAPSDTKLGDEICTLLGCDKPVVLRETNLTFNVVGTAYVDGLMYGDALLGPLPQGISLVLAEGYDGYYNHNMREVSREDPRLGPLPPEWQRVAHDKDSSYTMFYRVDGGHETTSDPRLSVDALRQRGLPLETFLLL